jgi:ribosome-associated protein
LAISEAIEERLLEESRRKPKHVEGRRVADWILMDFIDVVVHVFVDEKREFYGLERLWGDAPRVEIQGASDARSRPARRRPSASR